MVFARYFGVIALAGLVLTAQTAYAGSWRSKARHYPLMARHSAWVGTDVHSGIMGSWSPVASYPTRDTSPRRRHYLPDPIEAPRVQHEGPVVAIDHAKIESPVPIRPYLKGARRPAPRSPNFLGLRTDLPVGE